MRFKLQNMDKKDRKILIELDKDPQITTSKLAKRVRISQQVADYRNIIDKKFGYDAISEWLDIILNNKIERNLNYEHRNG